VQLQRSWAQGGVPREDLLRSLGYLLDAVLNHLLQVGAGGGRDELRPGGGRGVLVYNNL
jgi:hypothetical protein